MSTCSFAFGFQKKQSPYKRLFSFLSLLFIVVTNIILLCSKKTHYTVGQIQKSRAQGWRRGNKLKHYSYICCYTLVRLIQNFAGTLYVCKQFRTFCIIYRTMYQTISSCILHVYFGFFNRISQISWILLNLFGHSNYLIFKALVFWEISLSFDIPQFSINPLDWVYELWLGLHIV